MTPAFRPATARDVDEVVALAEAYHADDGYGFACAGAALEGDPGRRRLTKRLVTPPR